MTTYYKILVNGKSCHGGNYEWSLPDGDKPGEWTPKIEKVSKCKVGYHLTTKPYKWYSWGCDCYEAEVRGMDYSVDDKVVCHQARLMRKVDHPQWWNNAIEFVDSISDVKFFVNQKADPSWKIHDTLTAAWNAALAAVLTAARDAAWDAARDAAWDAARDAAWDAARDAAWDAAWNAARDAAWNAARNAAWNAARGAARGAAWDAARDAARDAAWDAARDAARDAALVACAIISEVDTSYAMKRWDVWKRGYGLLEDVNGVFYVYRRP